MLWAGVARFRIWGCDGPWRLGFISILWFCWYGLKSLNLRFGFSVDFLYDSKMLGLGHVVMEKYPVLV